MSKDDMETATMNVMFDGSEEKDDNDEYNLEEKEDNYNIYSRLRRYSESR